MGMPVDSEHAHVECCGEEMCKIPNLYINVPAKTPSILSLWAGNDELWRMVEQFSKLDKTYLESVTCIQQLPTVQ